MAIWRAEKCILHLVSRHSGKVDAQKERMEVR